MLTIITQAMRVMHRHRQHDSQLIMEDRDLKISAQVRIIGIKEGKKRLHLFSSRSFQEDASSKQDLTSRMIRQ